MTQHIILIADDQDSIRLLVSASLAEGDVTVLEAEDGDEAWAAILEHRPHIAILDVQMPGHTGIELTRAIRSDDRLRGMGIILLSAKTQDADIEAGMKAGADHYLTKPFLPSDLEDLVHQLLAR